MNFNAALSYIRTEIEEELQGRATVQPGFLNEFVKERSGICSLLNEDLMRRIIKHLETIYWTTQNDGHSLASDFKSWYPARILSDDYKSYYWRRLKKYWNEHSVLPRDSIRSTDKVTDEIMDYIGDPGNEESWRRRGLVMGHVQSGKTTNYSALITKAADAGYRIIIVLAGLTNSLRTQTQERLDETFVGKSSIGDELNIDMYPVSMVFAGMEGEPRDPKHPYCGTTRNEDFSVTTTRAIRANEGNFADPILFVTKKHTSILENLAKWLSSLRQGRELDGPMLLIDDEADNASVNTSKESNEVTRINQRIREVLRCSRRTTYIGYTATPFANIFIHPDSNDEMLKEDLFPSHFIKSLDPPDNYIGARELFSEGGRLSEVCVKEIPDDFRDLLPLKHKSNHIVVELPRSLVNAVYEFFLFRAIRLLDRETASHSSMMVNVSRFNKVQRSVYDLIEELKENALHEADVWSKSDSWEKSGVLQRISEVWFNQYDVFSEHSWDEIRKVLSVAISPIEVRLVNMQGSGLNYSERKNNHLHVIAIGGLALARGLTLSGLAVSYILRNVGAADTLLQMGRWFGYRPGYEKLCRIHLTLEMRAHFTHISTSVEELRDDLVRMEKMRRTPNEFGLKVRESPTGIAITAANKMRSAKPVLMAVDLSLRHIQAFELLDDNGVNQNHLEAVRRFYQLLTSEKEASYDERQRALVWGGVDAAKILDFLEQFEFPQMHFARMTNGSSLIADYIRDRANQKGELDEWDVAIPFTTSTKASGRQRIRLPFNINDGELLYCRQRISGVISDKNVKVTEKNVVADPGADDLYYGESAADLSTQADRLIAEIAETEGINISRERAVLSFRGRPLLLIHMFQFDLRDKLGKHSFDADQPVVSLSLGFTGTEIEAQEHQYAATVRLMEQMKLQLEENESDDLVGSDD